MFGREHIHFGAISRQISDEPVRETPEMQPSAYDHWAGTRNAYAQGCPNHNLIDGCTNLTCDAFIIQVK